MLLFKPEPFSYNWAKPEITLPTCKAALPQDKVCTTEPRAATDSTWREEAGPQKHWWGGQADRQDAARKHGKGRLTNCFCSLWEGAARHGLVWARTFRRVKSDPARQEEEKKAVKRRWEEWKRKRKGLEAERGRKKAKWEGQQNDREWEANIEEYNLNRMQREGRKLAGVIGKKRPKL